MAAWMPYVIQAGEALFVGIVAFGGTFQVTHDWTASLSAAIAAIGGKALPNQLVGKKPA